MGKDISVVSGSRHYYFSAFVNPALKATSRLRRIGVVHQMFNDAPSPDERDAARLIEDRHSERLDYLALTFDPHGSFPRVRCRVLQLGSAASSFDGDPRAGTFRAQYLRGGFTAPIKLDVIEAQEVILWNCAGWTGGASLPRAEVTRVVHTSHSVLVNFDLCPLFIKSVGASLTAVYITRALLDPDVIANFQTCPRLQEARVRLGCDVNRQTPHCACRDAFNAWLQVPSLRTLVISRDSEHCICLGALEGALEGVRFQGTLACGDAVIRLKGPINTLH
jgi:hypothetical protein